MFDLIAIGDPVIDTHVQIDESCKECEINPARPDQVCLDYGAKIPIIDSFQNLGGNAPNVAVAASILGLKTALMSTVGGDVNGEIALKELSRHAVDVSMVSRDHASKTRYSIVLNYRGERTILSYSSPKTYVWPVQMPGAEWIYYTGLSEGFEVIQDALVEYLKKHATTKLAINPGSYIMKYALPRLLEMLPLTDVLIVNREEAELLLGTTFEREKRHEALVNELLALGPDEVVLTDGINGSWAGTKEGVWHLDAYPATVTAKTGAGDAFSAGYLSARHHGHDPAISLEWGTANSTSVIQHHGPHKGLLTYDQATEMVKKFPNIKPTRLA